MQRSHAKLPELLPWLAALAERVGRSTHVVSYILNATGDAWVLDESTDLDGCWYVSAAVVMSADVGGYVQTEEQLKEIVINYLRGKS